jgi:hypothetical protein
MWGVPVDHEMFADISNSQWLWYFFNDQEDQQEDFETRRDFVEYHASFIEPQAVGKIKEKRDGKATVGDASFENTIKSVFGRDAELGKIDGKVETVTVNPSDVLKNMKDSSSK